MSTESDDDLDKMGRDPKYREELDDARANTNKALEVSARLEKKCNALRAEITRLTACLSKANDLFEEYERKFYLSQDIVDECEQALELIKSGSWQTEILGLDLTRRPQRTSAEIAADALAKLKERG